MLILQIVNSLMLFVILILFLLLILRSIRKKLDLIGNPPINKILFMLAKIANFTCWGIFIFLTAYSYFVPYRPLLPLYILSTIFLLFATLLILFSFRDLGDLNKFGLPSAQTHIIATGVYAFSRNPMYVGFYCFNIASALFFPHIVNIAFAVTGIGLHHFIVLGEERFMEKSFGKAWGEYKGRVRRYL